MTTTLSYGTLPPVVPELVIGWEAERDSRNLEHPLIGGGREITHTAPSLRTGTFQLLFTNEADLLAADELHQLAPYVDMVSDDREVANMRYVLAESGRVGVVLADTRDAWILSVEFREVSA